MTTTEEDAAAAPGASRVLVLNSGSSSVKYQLLDMRDHSRLASGLVERIGEETSRLVHTPPAGGGARSASASAGSPTTRRRSGRRPRNWRPTGSAWTPPNWRRSATGWCTAGCASPSRP